MKFINCLVLSLFKFLKLSLKHNEKVKVHYTVSLELWYSNIVYNIYHIKPWSIDIVNELQRYIRYLQRKQAESEYNWATIIFSHYLHNNKIIERRAQSEFFIVPCDLLAMARTSMFDF